MSTSDSSVQLQEQGGRAVIGVHLDIDALRVVEMSRGRISQWANVPYPPGLQASSKEFPAFLKKSLADFHSVFRRASIWAVGPLPSLQVRFLSLPKARPRQLSNLVYWTFRKEIPFDAAQTVFDYDVEGDVAGAGATKKTTDATAYTVAQGDVNALVDLFDSAGVHVDGVVIPSFALRNLFRVHPQNQPGPVLGLYVGSEASSLLFLKGKHVVAHRVFKTGMNVMLDVLRDRHPDWSPAKAYQTIADALRAVPSPEEAQTAEAAASEASQISSTVHTSFSRLIQQVERSMSAYLVGRSEEEIRNLHIAGSLAGLPPLVREMGSKLGLASQPLDLFKAGLMESKVPGPTGPEEAGMMAIALGAALSDPSHTPNLLHTYVKRAQEARQARWRMGAIVLGVAVLALLAVAGGMVSHRNRILGKELEGYQTQIKQFAPYPDRAMIQSMVNKAQMNSQQLKSMADRSLPVAALNQLALVTPEDIRLTSISLGRDQAKGKKDAAGPPQILLKVEGMVFGAPGSQKAKMAAFVLRLEDAEMFEQVSQYRTEEGREGGEQVLLFGLDMKMDDLAAKPAPKAKEGEAP